MRGVSAAGAERSAEIVRNEVRETEIDFGMVITEIAYKLYPRPNTPAQIAAEVGCTVRNVELCLSSNRWSDTFIAFFVGEILRRHRMRNFKVTSRGSRS